MTKKNLLIIFLSLISFSKFSAQSSNLEKVTDAVLQININGKVEKCKTDNTGKFAISFSNESYFSTNKIEASVKVVSSNHKKSSNDISIKLTLIKNENLYYEFILEYDNVKRNYVITEQNDIKGNPQIKRGKGDPSKVGDKYMGQVAHF